MKLHLGCGSRRREGYVNIDARETAATDVVAKAWELVGFADNSVDEIYSRHMLEHLYPEDAELALREWQRILVPGGRLHLIVPDLEFHCRQLLGRARSRFPDQRKHAFGSIFGWRADDFGGSKYDVHLWGYDYEELSSLVMRYGFADISRLREGTDTEAWHLNIQAFKLSAEAAGEPAP
jgi:predicted SAM-dependent methyltransferase